MYFCCKKSRKPTKTKTRGKNGWVGAQREDDGDDDGTDKEECWNNEMQRCTTEV